MGAKEPGDASQPTICPHLAKIDAIPGLAAIWADPCPPKAHLAVVFINSTRQNNARMSKSLKHLTDMLHSRLTSHHFCHRIAIDAIIGPTGLQERTSFRYLIYHLFRWTVSLTGYKSRSL